MPRKTPNVPEKFEANKVSRAPVNACIRANIELRGGDLGCHPRPSGDPQLLHLTNRDNLLCSYYLCSSDGSV